MKRGGALRRLTPLKARRSPAKAHKRRSKRSFTPKPTFASLCRLYELPSWIKSKRDLRWEQPIEKGLCWEVIKKIVRLLEKDCYTCWRKDLIAAGLKADTGHCYPVAQVGSNNALSWTLKLLHLQCSYCNGPGQGEQGLYEERIKRDYGEAFLLEARQRRYKVEPIKNWTAKLEELWSLYNELRAIKEPERAALMTKYWSG